MSRKLPVMVKAAAANKEQRAQARDSRHGRGASHKSEHPIAYQAIASAKATTTSCKGDVAEDFSSCRCHRSRRAAGCLPWARMVLHPLAGLLDRLFRRRTSATHPADSPSRPRHHTAIRITAHKESGQIYLSQLRPPFVVTLSAVAEDGVASADTTVPDR